MKGYLIFCTEFRAILFVRTHSRVVDDSIDKPESDLFNVN